MLSGKNLLKNVDIAIIRYPEVFAALEEYDRTRRLKKINYKERVNFTIDHNLIIQFRSYCRKKRIKMSTKMEDAIREELKK